MTPDSRRTSTAPEPLASRQPGGGGRSVAATVLRFRELGIAVFVLLIVGVATLIDPRFLDPSNLRNILLYIPLITIVAMGQMMVIVSRNIDLSVGSSLALSAIIVGYLFVHHPDFPIWAAAILAVLIGTVLGAINGVLVAWAGIPAIIVTLATMSIYRGLVFIVSGGSQVSGGDLPVELIALSRTSPVFGIPWIILLAVAVVLLTYLLLRYTETGREIYAIGSNPEAAALRGIPVKFNVFLVFTLCGAAAGLAGILYASRFGYVNPGNTGVNFELIVISAAIIGGANVFGGSGTVQGTLLGCLLIGVIHIALAVLGISASWQTALYGLTILLAVSLDAILHRRLRKHKEGATMT